MDLIHAAAQAASAALAAAGWRSRLLKIAHRQVKLARTRAEFRFYVDEIERSIGELLVTDLRTRNAQ